GATHEILLRRAKALRKRRRHRAVDDLHAGTGRFIHLDPIEPRPFVGSPRADRPYLTRRQRIGANVFVTLDLGRGDKLFHPILADAIAELRVPKLGATDPLLLLLDSPPTLER